MSLEERDDWSSLSGALSREGVSLEYVSNPDANSVDQVTSRRIALLLQPGDSNCSLCLPVSIAGLEGDHKVLLHCQGRESLYSTLIIQMPSPSMRSHRGQVCFAKSLVNMQTLLAVCACPSVLKSRLT